MQFSLFCKYPLSGCGDMAILKFLNISARHVCTGAWHIDCFGGL